MQATSCHLIPATEEENERRAGLVGAGPWSRVTAHHRGVIIESFQENHSHCDLTVSVVIVEDGQAGLGVSVELGLLPVVRLLHPEAPGGAPVVEPE